MSPRPLALLIAVSLDLAAGEPSPRWHPVVWMGQWLAWADRRVGTRTCAAGGGAVIAITVAVALGAAALGALARRLGPLVPVAEGLALKPAFALRRLDAAAAEVQTALAAGRLHEARRLAGLHLVSRPTGELAASEVTSAAIESLAENLGDSVAAPLLAYAVGGLPAAWAYRALNTADAMWGYRDARYAAFGRVAARLDDVANLVPARLAAAALVAAARLAGEDAGGALRVARRDHRRTASPNAGWPMAAMAGALGVGLAKRDGYRLGDDPLPAAPEAIGRGRRVFAVAAALVVAAALAVALARSAR